MCHLLPKARSCEHQGPQRETGEWAKQARSDGKKLQVRDLENALSWTLILKSNSDHDTMMIRFVWVDELKGRNFFIIIATYLPDRNEHVLVWALRKQEKESLKEKCLDVIWWVISIKKTTNMIFHCSANMKSNEKEEIKGLELPRCLEDSLCEMMAKLWNKAACDLRLPFRNLV